MDVGFDDSVTSVSESVVKHISYPCIVKKRDKYHTGSSFSFKQVTESSIALILSKINPRKTTGYDHIPGKIMRIAYQELSSPITSLTHWGRVTHICVGKRFIIGSDNGLSPERRQAIIWTNAGILLIGPLGTNFSEILIEILTISFKKMHLKVSSAKWRPLCLGLNVLINNAISANAFPSVLKCAEISPGFRNDDNLIRGNYRLVNVLPISSKIYESVMNDQLFEYFLDKFHDFLCAFRRKYSCKSVLPKAVHDWKYALDLSPELFLSICRKLLAAYPAHY